jgi:ATP-dependent Clp protease ATP-binding subunit ClpA
MTDNISALDNVNTFSSPEERIEQLETKVLELEMWIQALSRKINRLESQDIQPLQRDRGELLTALIASQGGKMLMQDARKMMHISESHFSELVAKTSSIEIKRLSTNKSKKLLILK